MANQEINNLINIKLSDREIEILKTLGYDIINSSTLLSKDEIVDKLSDLFCDIGLQYDDEPNEIGIAIEGLIDKFLSIK